MSNCSQYSENFFDIVDRKLNKVFTNGTLVDPELLTDEQAGHCVAVSEQPSEDGKDTKNNFGICVLDSSTSQFNLSAFEDDICRTKLETLMRQIRPKELLFTKVCFASHLSSLLFSCFEGKSIRVDNTYAQEYSAI